MGNCRCIGTRQPRTRLCEAGRVLLDSQTVISQGGEPRGGPEKTKTNIMLIKKRDSKLQQHLQGICGSQTRQAPNVLAFQSEKEIMRNIYFHNEFTFM